MTPGRGDTALIHGGMRFAVPLYVCYIPAARTANLPGG
jgi:hypothetical protein